MAKFKKFTGAKCPKRRMTPPKPRQASNIPQGISKEELEVFNMLKIELPNTQVIRGDRVVLQGREIDAYLPTYKLGIEYDGLYWHNTSQGKDASYHLHKTILAEQQGIRLMHIWSSDWTTKRPLVVDMLKKAIGKTPTIESDQCTFSPLGKGEADEFMSRCHILGADKESTKHYGLIYNGEILMAVSLRRNENWWEMTRIADRRGIRVLGGTPRIVDELRNLTKDAIVAVADRRYLDAYKIRECQQCTEIGATNPRKWYTKDFITVYNEEQFQELHRLAEAKHKKFDDEGWSTVWDCGERRFRL